MGSNHRNRLRREFDEFRKGFEEKTPLGRIGQPQDIAGVVTFLATDDARVLGPALTEIHRWLSNGGGMRLAPDRMREAASEDGGALFRDAENFGSFCRSALQGSPAAMADAQEHLRRTLPGFVELRVHSGGSAPRLVVTFQHPGGPAYALGFGALSDGQKTLIVLHVLHALARRASLLCIDDLDGSVGADDLARVLAALSTTSEETGLQVLVSARSREVAEHLDAEAILLERPEGGPTRVVVCAGAAAPA